MLRVESCSASPRLVVLGPGQRLHIVNRDSWPYEFQLTGSEQPPRALEVSSSLDIAEPFAPGSYLLKAKNAPIETPIIVVRYATQSVTGIDGRYRIEQVPVGSAQLSAYLPSVNASVTTDILVRTGENAYDIELP